ncbi:MAG: hypothetical protein ABI432_18010 [Flavobacteriales bacterium]
MRSLFGPIAWVCIVGCGAPDQPVADVPQPTPLATPLGFAPLEFAQVDDNLHHDTLLIQVTFDMGDGSFVMVASNMEETFEGVRLYRYRLKPDSTADMLAVSSPGYDSWTMLPTFFTDSATSGQDYWILANFGEKESWGQKLLKLNNAFTDLGFLDLALPERVMEDDTLRLKRRNIAPFARYSSNGDTAVFRFACDSVYLYDDQEGHNDVVLPANTVRYTYHPSEGPSLWLNGRKHLLTQPA